MRRYLLPAILKTVNLPTWSALENVFLSSLKLSYFVAFIILNHAIKLVRESGYFAINSRIRFLLIICTQRPLISKWDTVKCFLFAGDSVKNLCDVRQRGIYLTFWLAVSSRQVKMWVERLVVAHRTSVPLVRHPRSLPRNPEHPRSYGTAGSAAGQILLSEVIAPVSPARRAGRLGLRFHNNEKCPYWCEYRFFWVIVKISVWIVGKFGSFLVFNI